MENKILSKLIHEVNFIDGKILNFRKINSGE